jgi:hypothetical protein
MFAPLQYSRLFCTDIHSILSRQFPAFYNHSAKIVGTIVHMNDTETHDDVPPIEAYNDIEPEPTPDEDHPLLNRLNPVQREAVVYGDGPL